MNMLTKIRTFLFAQRGEGFRILRYENGDPIMEELDHDRDGKAPRTVVELEDAKKHQKSLFREDQDDSNSSARSISSIGFLLFCGMLIFSSFVHPTLVFVVFVIGLSFVSFKAAVIALLIGIFLSV